MNKKALNPHFIVLYLILIPVAVLIYVNLVDLGEAKFIGAAVGIAFFFIVAIKAFKIALEEEQNECNH